jgi:amidase
MELAFLSATAQAALIRRRELSSSELVDLYLERIARIDPELNAFVTVLAEDAREAARTADGTAPEAPFHGVPIGLKDLTATKGVRTTLSSRAYADFVPTFDSAVARRLREAGFVLIGKTNTPELGTTAFTESELNGSTRNPWDPARTPGGSSGGAAAALAAGLLPVAQGSDGGGSIRIPASCCGVFGLKPARGRVSAAPLSALEGLSTGGPLARTVEDAAAVLDVLEGYEPGDPWWAPPPERPFVEEVGAAPGRLRVAVTTTPPIDTPVEAACSDSLAAAAGLLADLGHDVREATPPWQDDDLILTFLKIWQVGPALDPIDDLSLLTPLNRELVESAHSTSAAEYGRAVARLHALARRVVAFWGEVDVVVTPTLALPPVPIGWQETPGGATEQLLRNAAFTPFTAIVNLTGQPAISLPLHWTEDGLPVGVQAIGPPAGEALLLRLAAQVEEARPWRDRRPPLA